MKTSVLGLEVEGKRWAIRTSAARRPLSASYRAPRFMHQLDHRAPGRVLLPSLPPHQCSNTMAATVVLVGGPHCCFDPLCHDSPISRDLVSGHCCFPRQLFEVSGSSFVNCVSFRGLLHGGRDGSPSCSARRAPSDCLCDATARGHSTEGPDLVVSKRYLECRRTHSRGHARGSRRCVVSRSE